MSLVLLKSKKKVVPVVLAQGKGKGKGKKKKARNRRRGRGVNSNNSLIAAGRAAGGTGLTAMYYKSLLDPFQYTGCRLGWGCMVPTTVVQAYIRGTSIANADGSITLLALPQAVNTGLFWTNPAATVNFAGTINSADQPAILANFSMGRVISLGIKAVPSIALTNAPGFCYAGALPFATANTLATMSTNDFVALPSSNFCGTAVDGAVSSGRPIDVFSYEFFGSMTNGTGFAATATYPFSTPYVSFIGMPGSTVVNFEICLNFEAITVIGHNVAGMGLGEEATTSLANEWSSPSSLWNWMKSSVPPPGQTLKSITALDAELGGIPSALLSKGLKQGLAYMGNRNRARGNQGLLDFAN